MDSSNQLLIHLIKTIQYRFVKATQGSKADFGVVKLNKHTRSPNEIIQHMYDLAVKTTCLIKGESFPVSSYQSLDFTGETNRFLDEMKELSLTIEEVTIDIVLCKKLLQGPISDIITHIGQIAMLSGLHGNKIPSESFYQADI
ncbi:hypothetical protein [Sediminibacterium goheungense]|uniref:DinB family protein n=1 Tax=Sediminibacterium goheungense TaxID=1086393 RepID=A0A4R6INI8_9BACT|nr:hypothetical protein [Sediminibacterium goheungense]TDO23495.1 hypothetical protein BC659_3355 [Sediminibacterium goheungense]TDO25098.1 hypothetical protein BC659_3113 [Sediminibacterium goheungense]